MAEQTVGRITFAPKERVAHTPGPWEYLQADGVIVTQESDWGAREIAWSDADHRLAAAAPDLLAALKALLSDGALDVALMEPDVISQARAAIAKAEGR